MGRLRKLLEPLLPHRERRRLRERNEVGVWRRPHEALLAELRAASQ
ncbi:hypothetical protein [Streptomyces olivochromogenes]